MAGTTWIPIAPASTAWRWPPKARGSSTCGAGRTDPRVETARVVPVVKGLVLQGITVSIDTMHAGVARAALESGAQMVNDVSGGRADAGMAGLLVEADGPWV